MIAACLDSKSQLEKFITDAEPEVILANNNTLQWTTDQNTRILGNPRPIPSKSRSWIFEGHYFGWNRDKWAENKFICNLCHTHDLLNLRLYMSPREGHKTKGPVLTQSKFN